MKVIKLVLSGYCRLLLSDIHHFEFTPEQTLQLILGTNGSGKSSILTEMTLFPTYHKDYVKGGWKQLTVEDKGVRYQYTFENTQGTGTHSLMDLTNNEELNPGGTGKAYQDVIEQLFNLDKDLNAVMLGTTRFSTMSTNDRRKWLARLCPVAMDGAFNLYKAVLSSQRDQKGVLNQLGKRLVEETHVGLKEDEISDIKRDVKRHHDKLEELFPLRKNVGTIHTTLEDTFNDWKSKSKELLAFKLPTLPGVQFVSRDTLLDKQRLLEKSLAVKESEYNSIGERIESIFRYLHQYEDDGSVGLEQAKATIADLDSQIADTLKAREIIPKTRFPIAHIYADGISVSAVESLAGSLTELLGTIPENKEGHYSQAKGKEVEEALVKAKANHRTLEDKYLVGKRRLQGMKDCDSVRCPNCSHSFKPGVDESDIALLIKTLEDMEPRLDKLSREIESYKDYLEQLSEYRDYVSGFRDMTRQYLFANALWEYCIEHKVAFRDPRKYVNDVHHWADLVINQYHVDRLTDRRKSFQDRVDLLTSADSDSLRRQKEEHTALEARLHACQLELASLNEEIGNIKSLVSVYDNFEVKVNQHLDRFDTILKQCADNVETHFQSGLKEDIRHHQSVIANLESKLHEHALQEGGRKAIEEQRARASEDQEIYGLLAEALNPTEGLIGQYLKASMGNIVNRINAIIGRVFTYPLEVLVSPLEKEDITYRFPLNVRDGVMSPPDIRFGSSSQRDIVDFAFKLTVMSCLGRTDIPLFMDELGSSFDEAHRINLVDMIESMLENQTVDQVFFVSHDLGTHGAFQHTDICVLYEKNITVPEKYNQHVVMSSERVKLNAV